MRLSDEWPTLALLVGVYAVFAGLTLLGDDLPTLIVVLGLAVIIAQHSSLQHEVLHGHPFKSGWLSDLTVFPALGLFVPYQRFKDTHLAHHYDPNLTDPYDDPETNFLDRVKWDKLPRPLKILAQFNNTLAGRMMIGPAISLALFYWGDLGKLAKGERRVWRSYLEHALGVALVLWWVVVLCEMPIWTYLMAAYLGMSLLKIRTFLEHQAHDRSAARSVIIEDRGPLALLFLNNNYHAVHHAHPKLAWHKLPGLLDSRRDHFLTRNGGYTYGSYLDVFRLFFLRAKDPVVHPLWTRSNRRRVEGQE
ncbi:MAG: fatty acid desaturase [Pseudomonadota bacterium]